MFSLCQQRFVFCAGDPPPFYKPNCRQHDEDTGKKRKKKAKKAKKQSGLMKLMVDAPLQVQDEEVDVIDKGYMETNKGLFQSLFERGWIDPSKVKEYSLNGKKVHGTVDTTYSLRRIMELCEDFMNETSAMNELCDQLGVELEKTPKKHPELAPIENCWGKAKTFHRRNNDFNSNLDALEVRVRAALGPDVLTLRRCQRFIRRANDYKRAYRAIDNKRIEDGEDLTTDADFMQIEKYLKISKTHRSSLDQDYKFINEA